MSDPGQFGPSISDYVRKTLERADRLKRAVGIKIFGAVIRDSPVGNPDLWKVNQGRARKKIYTPVGYVGGRFRANWNCSLNRADTSTSHSVAHQLNLQLMEHTVLTGDRNTVDFLANSLPYARRLEYEGWSRQAPKGMVRRNVARFRRILNGELNKLRTTGG